jgi:CheY-like chemotaxis protein
VNARDAMPAGGTLAFETGIADVDDRFARAHSMPIGHYVVIRVTDTGHGMSRDTKSRIFEPFFTTNEGGQGTGLGLSMVYGSVRQVGGYVVVDSEIGRGTMFTLYFPPALASVEPAAGPRSAPDAGPGSETLLIVEDETVVRDLVASTLAKDGYHLLLAASAEEALSIAAEHIGPIDLVVTDVIMPGKSGIELANTLVEQRPGLPVLLMSGYTGETLEVDGLRQRTMRLQKPFTPRELRQRVREVLDSRV